VTSRAYPQAYALRAHGLGRFALAITEVSPVSVAAVIHEHLTPKSARALKVRRTKAARARATLAPVPVERHERLEPDTGRRIAAETQVLDAAVPVPREAVQDARWSGGVAPLITDQDAAAAALRAHLAAYVVDRRVGHLHLEPQGADGKREGVAVADRRAPEYGPTVRYVATAMHRGSGNREQVILEGRLSAIHRLLPDWQTRQAMIAADVVSIRRDGVLIPLQMELTARP
jgi:hypothetical protein